jgi:hypothetical protein
LTHVASSLIAPRLCVRVREGSPQRCRPAAYNFVSCIFVSCIFVSCIALKRQLASTATKRLGFDTGRAECRPLRAALRQPAQTKCSPAGSTPSGDFVSARDMPAHKRRGLPLQFASRSTCLQKSAEFEMAFLAKKEGMPPDKSFAQREFTYGTAFWAVVRAGVSDKH